MLIKTLLNECYPIKGFVYVRIPLKATGHSAESDRCRSSAESISQFYNIPVALVQYFVVFSRPFTWLGV